jgi:hypothetical protein
VGEGSSSEDEEEQEEEMSPELEQKLADYFVEHSIQVPATADVAVALLRINTEESLSEVERMTGRKIKKCPAFLPCWPPKPVTQKRAPRVTRTARNPCLPTTPAFQRFRKIKIGMTEDQLARRGVTRRDLRRWRRLGHVEMG